MTTAETDAPASNGSVPATPPETPALPVDSYRDAAPYLRRPFAVNAIKFKVQATWPKGDPKHGLIVGYMDARLVVDRLNTVCPHLWFDEYQAVERLMMCKLTVDGISRRDVGEGTGKALYSDALKRAAVKFGIGVSLYAIPKMVLSKSTHLKDGRNAKNEPTLTLTDEGEKRCREMYARWLEDHGTEAFGKPLEHGDVENAQGDYEAEFAVDPAAEEAARTDRLLTEDERTKVLDAFKAAGLAQKDMQTMLVACGAGRVENLTVSSAFNLRSMLDEYLAKQAAKAAVKS